MLATKLLPARGFSARLMMRPALSRMATPATWVCTNHISLACGVAAPRPPSTCGATRHVHTGALLLQEARQATQPQPAAPRIAGAAPDHEAMMLRVTWAAGGEDQYPFIWMRDNCQCPACCHSTAKNRTMSMKALQLDVCPTAMQVSEDGQEVEVHWSDDHVSCFNAEWLQERTLNTHQQDRLSENFRLKMELWGSEKQGRLRRFSFPRLCEDDATLLAFLEVLEVEGLVVATDVPPDTEQFRRFTEEKLGYVRPTYYGQTFTVRNKQAASNVAYTSGALDLHNDMVYLEEKPGIQILHCLSQTKGKGGDLLLVDSFHVAKKMRESHPELFRVLADTVISFVDFGTDCFGQFHYAARHSVIECDAEGNVTAINVSNHSRDAHFAMSPEDAITWYRAYHTLNSLLVHPDNCITNKLQDGEMVVMDNYRVMHGRLAFEDSKGERHLVSGYWDWDQVRSKRRVLQALVSGS